MNWQEYWKAIMAFLGVFVSNVITQLTQHQVPWPTNGGEWARFLLTTLGVTFAVYAKGNAGTYAQVGKHEKH